MAQFVTINVRPAGYAVVTLQREPVNSLNLEVWTALGEALTALEAQPAVRGAIIISGLTKDVFTAGNDIRELHAPSTDRARYGAFWEAQNMFLSRLYASRLVTLAAIRGACPAGGAAIALCCDHRLMTPAGHIGLNEVLLGIPVPKYWGNLMARTIGGRAAESLLLTGRMASPQEALRLGLVDKLVEKEALLTTAEQMMAQLIKVPGEAFAATKKLLRAEYAEAWQAYCKEEWKSAWLMLTSEGTVKMLGATLQRLSKAKPKL